MRRRSSSLTLVIRYLAVLAIGFGLVFPIAYMFSASLMSKQDIFSTPIRLVPASFQWSNYVEIFVRFNLHVYFLNSVLVVICVVAGNAFLSTMVGYSLSKFAYPGRTLVFYFILGTMMVPLTVIVIPLYVLVRSLGWTDSYLALIIPVAMTPFGVFLMRQFVVGIPTDYIEAARIDGCTEFGILLRLILPLSVPGISALSIITFVYNWDSFLWPLIVISVEKYKTLPLGLVHFLGLYEQEWHLLMSASVVSVVPVLVGLFVLQRRFIEGMTSISGLKA